MSWYTKTIMVLVKLLKVATNCCLNWDFFYGTLYCCVKYSNIEYQDDISKLITQNNSQKKMAKFGFEVKFHNLEYFEVEI